MAEERSMSDQLTQEDINPDEGNKNEREKMLAKYPSLKKMMDNDDYPESHDGREDRLLQSIKNHPDLESMKNNPDKILAAIDSFAAKEDFLISIGPHKADIIKNLILENKPRVLVELGGYLGYSAIVFAQQMRGQATDDRPVQIWSIEKDEGCATIARDLISLAGMQDEITVVTGAGDEVLRKLKAEGKIDRIDFLFLDHVEELYERDLKVAMDELGLLQANACIVADNVVRPGAPKYREYVRNHEGLRSRGLRGLIVPGELEDELEISKVLPPKSDGEEDGEGEGEKKNEEKKE